LQTECRRCKADLSLVVRARNRIAQLLTDHEFARQTGDADRQQKSLDELGLLAPRIARRCV
jgi:hypothetical protein